MRFPSIRGYDIFFRIPRPSSWQRSSSSCGSTSPARKAYRLGGIIHTDTNRTYFDRCTTLTCTKSSLASNCYEDYENKDRESDPGGNGDNAYSIAVEDNGTAISVTATRKTEFSIAVYDTDKTDKSTITSNSWKFSSVLLWVNDPQYIHASSGQRVRTIGQYSRKLAIVGAQILCVNDAALQNLHSVPPRGSLHSRGGIYSNVDRRCTAQDRTLLKISWSDAQESIFDLEWLMDHAHNNCMGRSKLEILDNVGHMIYSNNRDTASDSSREGTIEKTTTRVTKDIAIGGFDNPSNVSIAKFDYREILRNEDKLFEGMQEIFEHGAILVQNAPNVEDNKINDENSPTSLLESIVGNLGKRFSGGSLSHGSLYGDVFHVQRKENAENIAYTNVALPPHQDLVYYESKPFLQLLHCATNSGDNHDGAPGDTDDPTTIDKIVGGESTLIDAMAAAEELRRVSPYLFEILCKTEATFVKERHDSDMVSPKSHIVVDPAYGQVVEVNWSPPFEGPLQIHPKILVEDYVRAYQAIECMLDDSLNDDRDVRNSTFLPDHLETSLRDYANKYTREYSLQKGDIIVFNNQRMLHGRRSFRSIGRIKRHLIGCYTDATDTLSQYRQLLRERKTKNGGGYGKKNPGSGYRWM